MSNTHEFVKAAVAVETAKLHSENQALRKIVDELIEKGSAIRRNYAGKDSWLQSIEAVKQFDLALAHAKSELAKLNGKEEA